MVFAPSLVKESQNRMFSILIRGIWFHSITDKTASARVTNPCCVQSELTVLHMEDCSSRYLHAGRHIHKTARIAPNLKRHRYSYYLRLYSGMSGSPEKHMGRTVPTYVEHVREIEAKWAKFPRARGARTNSISTDCCGASAITVLQRRISVPMTRGNG